VSIILDIKSATRLSGPDVAAPAPEIEILPPVMVPKVKRAINLSLMLDTLEENLAAYRVATGERPARGATVNAGGPTPWALLARQLLPDDNLTP
jgi:hypothetical protein